jgi:ATP-dependent Clp protease ATP-binding subunit ClpA
MFERYTTDARRCIFFARYEASSFGVREIDTEHLLLGILKAGPHLGRSLALAPFRLTRETIEKKIAAHRPPPREQISTSLDLPVSAESKRALALGAEEANRRGEGNIGLESLLLGLAREESCLAAQILREAGLTPDELRKFTARLLPPPAAPSPEEAVKILEGIKSGWEQFHGVTFAPGAIEMAIYASGRFLAHRALPDRALDLLDEAAARVRLVHRAEPSEIAELRKQIRRHARAMESADARLDPTVAREHFEAEGAARTRLRALLEQQRQASAIPPFVTPEDVEQVAAEGVGVPVSAIRAALAKKGPADLDEILARLKERIPIERNPWLPLLAAYIARGSDAEIDALLDAIRDARLR